jgi:hypothetical protein
MNNNEKIKKAEQLIAEAKELLNEVKAENTEEDVIAKYKEDYCKDKKYFIDNFDEIGYVIASRSNTFEKVKNPYQNYLTEELAKQAKKLKDFNDKLLAFKYCQDADYEPDWDTLEEKYYVYYSNRYLKYEVDSVTTYDLHSIYFSTEELAQKCADWLNSEVDAT